MHNQAMLFKLEGNLVNAKKALKTIISKYEDIYGIYHPSTLSALTNLGAVYTEMKQYDKACLCFEQVLEGRGQNEGNESLNYLVASQLVAGSYRDLKMFNDAQSLLSSSYITVKEIYGEDSVIASNLLNSMGLLYKKQGSLEKAQKTYEKSLTIMEEIMGKDNPDTIPTRHNLGELF